MRKNFFAELLAVIVLLTGCSHAGSESRLPDAPQTEPSATGAYTEQQFTISNHEFGFLSMHPNADNSITLLGSENLSVMRDGFVPAAAECKGYTGGLALYRLQPDGSSEKLPIPWEEELIRLCSNEPFKISAAMDEQGTLYLMASRIASSSYLPDRPFELYRVNGDQLETIPVDAAGLNNFWHHPSLWYTDYCSCQLLGVTGDSLFVSINGVSWAVLGTDGTVRKRSVYKERSDEQSDQELFDGVVRNGYFWGGFTDGAIKAYTMPDMEPVKEVQSSGTIAQLATRLFPDWSGDGFYMLTGDFNPDAEPTISHYSLSGDTHEILLHGNDFFWSAGYIMGGCETADGAFWLAVEQEDGAVFYGRYAYDPNKAVTKPLTVFSLYHNRDIQSCISIWNRQHLDAQINYVVGINDEEPVARTEEDVLRQLNTRLLAGEGPDVLLLDGLPIENLIKKGIFADLSDLLDLSAVRPNVRSAFERNGKLYAIPTHMGAYIVGGTTETVKDLNSLDSIARQVQQDREKVLAYYAGKDLIYEYAFDCYYPASADAIWKDGHFQKESFLAFAHHLDQICRPIQTVTQATALQSQTAEQLVEFEQLDRRGCNFNRLLFDYNICDWFVDCWTDFSNFGQIVEVSESGQDSTYEYPPISLLPLPGAYPEGVFEPRCIAAIPESNLEHRQLAADFIQIFLSDEIQSSRKTASQGLPVTESGLNLQISEQKQYTPVSLDSDVHSLLNKMHPALPDPARQAAVREVAAKLYDGEYTEEKACKAIEQVFSSRLAKQDH